MATDSTTALLGRALGFAEDAAARVIRREILAVRGDKHRRGGAVRFAGDSDRWRTWVSEFYARHVDYVATVLRIDTAKAVAYCTAQRDELLDRGIGAVEGWGSEEKLQAVVALALARPVKKVPGHLAARGRSL
jgi:hypothetical protein